MSFRRTSLAAAGRVVSLMAGLAVGWLFAVSAGAQSGNPTSATNPYFGSVTMVKATPDVLKLSLDDAVRMGLEYNLGLRLAQASQGAASGQTSRKLAPMLPDVTLTGGTGIHQYNLKAQGFRPGILKNFYPPGTTPPPFDFIPVVEVANGQGNYSQTLFDLSTIERYRAAKANEVVAYYNMMSARGSVVQTVSDTYLQALAAASQVDNAKGLLRTDDELLRQAVEAHKAGTAANLDELRARVTYQTQEQQVIASENSFEKTKILLNREIGLPAEQTITLTDTVPYADLAAMSIEDAKQTAYANRQDYQSMLAQVKAAELTRQAAKHERLPSARVDGNYGVTGVYGSVYHGTFAVVGSLSMPLFEEAKLRGDRSVAESQLTSTMSQMADLKTKIDGQVRTSLLDVETAAQLVHVAESNVELSQKTLEQVTDRYTAGIDDNLPVVEAQTTLSSAQTRLVSSLYQYNVAKLALARSLGIVELQYKAYLGR